MFNKEALVHALLNRTLPSALAHITSLKQLVPLKLDPVPGAGAAGRGAAAADWQCPVTGLEMNGRARFVVHRPTGRAVSERALKEAPAAVRELFGAEWAAGDLIQVNPTGEELLTMRERLAARLAAERQKKLAKKLAKRAAAGGGEGAAAEAAAGGGSGSGGEGRGGGGGGSPGGAAAAAVAGAKRPAQDALAGGVPAAAAAGAPAAAAAASGDKPAAKKPKPSQVKVPENATAEIYKSIFHTAEQAAAMKETYACRAVSGRWRC